MTEEKNKGGRPRKPPAERTARRTVTLRQRQIDAIKEQAQAGEEFSTTLQRLLDTHPAFVDARRSVGAQEGSEDLR
jgi:hypothetical protein